MILSICIPTLPERRAFLIDLIDNLHQQIFRIPDKVELLFDPRARAEEENGCTTGEKRNALNKLARGQYVWHVDDDDFIFPNAIASILKAAESGPDVIGINGIMTSDGLNERGWEIRLGHPYEATVRDGKEFYLRWPNHITPIKKNIATQILFPDKTIREDYEWSLALKESGLLKTQEVAEGLIYHYRERSKK